MHITKEAFYIKKLSIFLSFFFDEDDVGDIIYDYTERFHIASFNKDGSENELLLRSPLQECRQIVSDIHSSPFKAFLSQKKFKLFLMILLFTFLTCYSFIWCDKKFVGFLFPVLIINFTAFLCGCMIDKASTETARFSSIFHVFLLICTFSEILVIGICMPYMHIINAGKFCVQALQALVLILLLVSIVIIAIDVSIHRNLILLHHILMVILISMYIISQMRIMQKSISAFSFHIVVGTLSVYLESTLLYMIKIILNHFLNKSLWMHN